MESAVVTSLAERPQFIDGGWRPGTGDPFEVVNPARGQPLATLAGSTSEDASAALSAARRAQPAWSRRPPIERGDLLRSIADVFAANRTLLRDLLVSEVGKPATQAASEVAFAEAFLRYNAGWDRHLEGEILAGDVAGETIHLLRAPVGVVAAICPWNFPLAVFCRKVAPALLTGNTVVAKASEVTPLTTLQAVRLISDNIDLPAGVLNLVSGAGDVGNALVESELTSLVSFTGHRDTGKRVMATAAANLTRVALELGGKAPAIVWKDADLDLAVGAIIAARHTNAGQVCTSAERVLIHEDVLEDFTSRYIRAAEALRVGDPSGDVDMGPLVSAAQLEKTGTAVERAVREGADLLTGGGPPRAALPSGGYWYAPTVLRDVDPDMNIMTEETFGPVTPLFGVGSLDDAIGIANESRYGLSAYVFSQNYSTIMRTVEDLQFGEIYINRTLGESVHAHHAGFKQSGIGGEDGKWGILRYTQIKTAYHHFGGSDQVTPSPDPIAEARTGRSEAR
jgi:lactaldehyde dehydrogenase/glycolaldehyde dehydrogenase